MPSAFDQSCFEIEGEAARLPVAVRGRFLLVYAQRFEPAFAQFEALAKRSAPTLATLLDQLWQIVERDGDGVDEMAAALDAIIPGEEWVVDGFYDAIAQYVGGMAFGAATAASTLPRIDGRVEGGAFEVLRLFLCEMRLGCSESGDDEVGRAFESSLLEEPLVVEEVAFWRELQAKLADGIALGDLRAFALANRFNMGRLEPALSDGLARDAASARQPGPDVAGARTLLPADLALTRFGETCDAECVRSVFRRLHGSHSAPAGGGSWTLPARVRAALRARVRAV